MEKGFENTSVEDIVVRAGTAKGLFYYYFDSKEELVLAITDRLLDEIEAKIVDAIRREGRTAMERFGDLLASNEVIRARSKMLAAYFHQERNQALHFSLEERGRKIMAPALERIIEQGVEEGVFSASYPKETALALLGGLSALRHDSICLDDPGQVEHLVTVIQYLTERLLGARRGTFQVYRDSLPLDTKGKFTQR